MTRALAICGVLLTSSVVAGPGGLFPNERVSKEKGSGPAPKFREWMKKVIFPEFRFSGSLDGAITHLKSESRKFSPDGRAAGGFILRIDDASAIPVYVHLQGKNALELVDAICGDAGLVWEMTPYAIRIRPM